MDPRRGSAAAVSATLVLAALTVVATGAGSVLSHAGVTFLAAVATVVGPRWYPPARTKGIRLITTAMVIATVNRLLALPTLPWADEPGLEALLGLLSMAIFACLIVGTFRMTAARMQDGRRELTIDMILVVVAVAAVLHDLVVSPALAQTTDDASRIMHSLLPVMQAPVLACCFRLLASGGHRIVSAWFISAAATSGLIAMVIAATSGTADLPSSAELLVVLSGCFIVAAHLHPSFPRVSEPAPVTRSTLSAGRLTVIALALLALPATMLRADGSIDSIVPALAAIVCVLLVVWRMTLMVRELNRHMRFEQALASIGRMAVSADGPATFHERSTVIVEQATDGDWTLLQDGRTVSVVADRAVPSPELGTFLATLTDLVRSASRRWDVEAALTHQVRHDALTGLPNRFQILERLRASADNGGSVGVSVLFIDLDGFKAINDRHGHAVGDELLVAVAGRLTASVRPSDIVARLAGDEFVVLSSGTAPAVASDLAERLGLRLREPYELSVGPVEIGASIGLSAGGPGIDPEMVLRKADQRMYEVKHAARRASAGFSAPRS